SLYIFIAGFAIAAPVIIAQSYLQTASGKLTKLDNIGQIEKQSVTKYYSLKNFYIDKNNIGVRSSFDVSGKNNESLNMNLFIALPILNSYTDTTSTNCIAWYGMKYHEQISNRLDKNEKEERFQKFANESQSDFDKKDVSQFIYFDRIGNTDDHKGYISAIKNDKKYTSSSRTILIPVNEPFEARNGNKFAWIFGAFSIGAAIWLIMLLIPKFDEEALDKFKSGITTKETDMKEALSFFLPREGFYVTPVIMDLNILIFILMVFSGLGFISFKSADLLAWGANYKPVTTDGQWWRLLTNTFLHGGLMHLLANMYGLLFVGIFLEPKLGKIKYAIIYLATGIIASIASLYLHDATISIGASGAIFGLYGVFLSLLLTKVFPKDFSKAFLTSTLIFIGYNLLMGFAGAGIDNAAHIGGLVSGFIIGLILYPKLKQQTEEKLLLKPVEMPKNE
ncbi:MAG TPA: rhomboid family intramembrane serine protease, partial [Puia sp.]|nr:rhomboid family intramembrane serine protease [Puia sp.]